MGAILATAAVALALAGVAVYEIFRRYARAREESRRVRELFSRYVPPQVVEGLLARKDPRLFEAHEYYGTIVSCRIRNYALFAENLTPEETLRYLNEFHAIAGNAIGSHGGMIESLRGDGITGVFGVLIDKPFQEERALRACLDIVRMVSAMNARWQAQERQPFDVTIGVNSGKIVAGDVGFQQRREYAIVGNPAQVAARLQEAAEDLNAYVLASASTFDPVADLFVGVPASTVPLRGLKRLAQAYIVRGLTKDANDRLRVPAERHFARTVVLGTPEAETSPPPPPPPPSPHPPEPAMPAFSSVDDEAPAMPPPPPLIGTYEDGQGPPVQLPP